MEEPFEVLPIQAISGACVAGVHEIMERHAGELCLLQFNLTVWALAAMLCDCWFSVVIVPPEPTMPGNVNKVVAGSGVD